MPSRERQGRAFHFTMALTDTTKMTKYQLIERIQKLVETPQIVAEMLEAPNNCIVKRNHPIWAVIGIEISESGLFHGQCAVHMAAKCTKKYVGDLIHPMCSTFHSDGNADDQRAYCFKTRKADMNANPPRPFDDVPNTEIYEFGYPMRPGTRNDLQDIGERIVAGVHPREIARTNPAHFIRFHRGMDALRAALRDVPRDDSTPKNVIVHYGPTGTGKTRTAIANAKRDFGSGNYYIKSAAMGEWWDGYDAHKCVIIDEFRSSFRIEYLLQLLDRNEFRVQVKGGSREFVADTIYITTPSHPDEWYPNAGTDLVKAQIKRRITQIIHMDTPVD